ncbi:MAG: hypothetical protein NT167_32150 [Verrucomicrobia bacterium]|nr:hypothetical protein [Verrucomicrobiota bacterium]
MKAPVRAAGVSPLRVATGNDASWRLEARRRRSLRSTSRRGDSSELPSGPAAADNRLKSLLNRLHFVSSDAAISPAFSSFVDCGISKDRTSIHRFLLLLRGVMLPLDLGPIYRLGRVVITPGARARLLDSDIVAALLRHLQKAWGKSNRRYRLPGRRAPLFGCRILTAAHAVNGTAFWIISEADKSITRVILPQDYCSGWERTTRLVPNCPVTPPRHEY